MALCALVALLIFQILTPDEALSGFSNSVVIMMVGLFVVGGAIFQTGLAKMISSHILKLAGKSELKLFLLVMLVTSAIGAFVSNTGTVALMLPIVVSLAVSANMNPSRLLMPLAFASSMGGMMTLIVDYLFVDMPPGTGDVAITVYQSLKLDGIIIVTSPQDLVSMIVEKAVKMADLMQVPIIGVVENYSYFHCPDNGKDYQIFGESHIEEILLKIRSIIVEPFTN